MTRAASLLLLACVACSSAPPEEPPLLTQDANASASRSHGSARPPGGIGDDGAEDPLPGVPVDAGSPTTPTPSSSSAPAPLVIRKGTLAASPLVEYGGDPYCTYRTTMKDVAVDIRTDPLSGKVVAASVEAKAIEEAVQPCPYAPYPPNQQLYHLDTTMKLTTGQTRILLDAAEKNFPQAALILDIDLSSPSGTTTSTLTWHRTDATAPFDWKITATVAVTTL